MKQVGRYLKNNALCQQGVGGAIFWCQGFTTSIQQVCDEECEGLVHYVSALIGHQTRETPARAAKLTLLRQRSAGDADDDCEEAKDSDKVVRLDWDADTKTAFDDMVEQILEKVAGHNDGREHSDEDTAKAMRQAFGNLMDRGAGTSPKPLEKIFYARFRSRLAEMCEEDWSCLKYDVPAADNNDYCKKRLRCGYWGCTQLHGKCGTAMRGFGGKCPVLDCNDKLKGGKGGKGGKGVGAGGKRPVGIENIIGSRAWKLASSPRVPVRRACYALIMETVSSLEPR